MLRRLLAYLVDLTILYLIWLCLARSVQWTWGADYFTSFHNFILSSSAGFEKSGDIVGFFHDALGQFAAWLYYIILLNLVYATAFEFSRLKATPGKLLFGLSVVNDRQTGLAFFQVLLRSSVHLLYYAPVIIVYLFAINGEEQFQARVVVIASLYLSVFLYFCGHVIAFATERQQAFHDTLSGAFVIISSRHGALRFVLTSILASLFCFSIFSFSYDPVGFLGVIKEPKTVFNGSLVAVNGSEKKNSFSLTERWFFRPRYRGGVMIGRRKVKFEDGMILWHPDLAFLEVAFFVEPLSAEQRQAYIDRRSLVPERDDPIRPYAVISIIYQPESEVASSETFVDYGLTFYNFEVTKSMSFDLPRDKDEWLQKAELKSFRGKFRTGELIAGSIEGEENNYPLGQSGIDFKWRLVFRDKL